VPFPYLPRDRQKGAEPPARSDPLPAPPAVRKKAKAVYFYPDGRYVTLDEFDNQVDGECGLWHVAVVADQLRRGVIDETASVNLPGVFSGRAADLKLGSFPAGDPKKAAQVFFFPQGTYFTSTARKDNIREECGDWYVVVLRGQLRRGVVDDNTAVSVPTVFTGPLGVLRSAKGF
jgi:hypothetical protein